LISVEEALSRVLANVEPLPAQFVPLGEAYGRVLAADLQALRTQPPADVSAMDGYAVRAADVAAVPARLNVVGEVAAGHPFSGCIGPGQAARIFTGGILPAGADAIVIQENTAREDDTVIVTANAAKGKHVRGEGLDFRRGAVLLHKGRRLSDRDLALAAAMNHARVWVHGAPRLAVLATGDELVMPGSDPKPGEIVYSNGYSTMATAAREGCEVIDLGIVRDRVEDTVAAIRRARELGSDVLATSGGASVGDYDLVQGSLRQEGLALSFWKVALRPGRPLLHGRLGPMHVLGLPGNPVSAYVCSILFLVPLLRRLAGWADIEPALELAVLGRDLPQNDERADYLRAKLSAGPNGLPIATPAPVQDSSMLCPLADADCLLVREPHAPAAAKGSACKVLPLPR
jgi:molybdopterin molybdotransferase